MICSLCGVSKIGHEFWKLRPFWSNVAGQKSLGGGQLQCNWGLSGGWEGAKAGAMSRL